MKASRFVLLLLALSLLAPTVAAAQGFPPAKPFVGEGGRDTGIMLRLGLGVTGCTDDACDHVDPGLNLRLEALYRLKKYVAVGLHFNFSLFDAENVVGDQAGHLFLGVEGRGILPLKFVDLWTGLTMGWSRTMIWGSDTYLGQEVDYRYWSDGFALGWGLGADFYITRSWAVGLSFWLYKPWYDDGCGWDSATEDSRCDELSEAQKDNIGIVWAFGANATYYFGR
jgi:opacity protein-like surface antigen